MGAQDVKVPQIHSYDSGGAIPVRGHGRGERWLGCGCSQPLVPAVLGSRPSVMEPFGKISSSSALPVSSPCCTWKWIHVPREALDEFQYFLRCGEIES